jgi:hypothetical protein
MFETSALPGYSWVAIDDRWRAFAPQSRSQRPEKSLSGPVLTARSADCAGRRISPISARKGHRSKLAAQAPDGKTARRPATAHGDGGPHAKSDDDKPERRFSGLLSAMAGASGYRTHRTAVTARAAGLMPASNFSRCSTGVRQGLLREHPPPAIDSQTTVNPEAPLLSS